MLRIQCQDHINFEFPNYIGLISIKSKIIVLWHVAKDREADKKNSMKIPLKPMSWKNMLKIIHAGEP